ncbi:MAG: hypothetical protein WBA17_05475 [Saprospiraceae bacterium]
MKTLTTKNQYRQWLEKAPLGLVIIGFGACLIAEAATKKAGGAKTATWLAEGTAALVVFNAGISIFGDAVKHRTHYERLRERGENNHLK